MSSALVWQRVAQIAGTDQVDMFMDAAARDVGFALQARQRRWLAALVGYVFQLDACDIGDDQSQFMPDAARA